MSQRIDDERRTMAARIGLNGKYDFFRPVFHKEGESLARTFFVLSQRFAVDEVGLEELRQAYDYMMATTRYGDDGTPISVSIPGYNVFRGLCEQNGIKL